MPRNPEEHGIIHIHQQLGCGFASSRKPPLSFTEQREVTVLITARAELCNVTFPKTDRNRTQHLYPEKFKILAQFHFLRQHLRHLLVFPEKQGSKQFNEETPNFIPMVCSIVQQSKSHTYKYAIGIFQILTSHSAHTCNLGVKSTSERKKTNNHHTSISTCKVLLVCM